MERKGKGRIEDFNFLGIFFLEKCLKCSFSMNIYNILCIVSGVSGVFKV